MRVSLVLLTCLMLSACGKTGALYLPEEKQAPPPENTETKLESAEADKKAD